MDSVQIAQVLSQSEESIREELDYLDNHEMDALLELEKRQYYQGQLHLLHDLRAAFSIERTGEKE